MTDGGFQNRIIRVDEYIPVQIYDTLRLIEYLDIYKVRYIGRMENGVWMEKMETLPDWSG